MQQTTTADDAQTEGNDVAGAASYVLLMRHGAGVKISHDPVTTPPGPDHILTAQGFGGGPATEPERTLSRFGCCRMFARPR